MAILNNQVRTELRPSKRGRPRQARRKRVLDGVLGVVHRSQHAVAVPVELGPVGFDQVPKGGFVALPSRTEQHLLVTLRKGG